MESKSWTPDSTQQKDMIFHGKYDELMSPREMSLKIQVS